MWMMEVSNSVSMWSEEVPDRLRDRRGAPPVPDIRGLTPIVRANETIHWFNAGLRHGESPRTVVRVYEE